ncbi:MAG: putative corrinoid protein [Ilumatobacteraceae bacterium]|nr:putative corrinoid protein [Ilumatobacteraceae bacterium]
MTESDLTLHEAAALLGVHYMTAYRYVRLGLLPAEKIGGTWCVGQDDLAAFRDHQGGRGTAQQPLDAPSDAGAASDGDDASDAETVVGERSGRLRAPWAERLEARLLVGDVRGAWGVVEAALAAGSTLTDIYMGVLTPALVSIGERWVTGEIDIADEHRATGIVTRLIGRLGPRFARRGRSRGVVVLGCPAGEHHALPLAMVADLVRQRGWEVSDLGGDLPAASFARAVTNIGPDVVAVGISVTNSDRLDVAAETIAAIRAAAPDVTVILGGRVVVNEAHARSLGAGHFSARLDGILEILDQTVSVALR